MEALNNHMGIYHNISENLEATPLKPSCAQTQHNPTQEQQLTTAGPLEDRPGLPTQKNRCQAVSEKPDRT